MFAAFIYTECISPGPFKRESGFKFKSVEEVLLSGPPTPQPLLEQRMNLASAAFLPYKAPTIDSFMKPEEFRALAKQWSVQELNPGSFMFTRLFTSGVSNGRPDNPFHQGFIFDFSDIEAIVTSTGEMSGRRYSRPSDFASWTDWLNPRGDDELEAAVLEEHNPPMPAMDSSMWSRLVEKIFEADTDDSMQILSGFESAMRNGTNFGIATESVGEFLDWISFLTHLIPLKAAWTMQFTSNEAAEHFVKVPARTSVYRSDAYIPRVDTGDWAALVKLVVEAGIYSEIDDLIGELSKKLIFDPNDGLQSLTALPLACCLLDQNLLDPADLAGIQNLVAKLMTQLAPPTHWTTAEGANQVLDRLVLASSILRTLSNGDAIYARLSSLPALVSA